MWDGDRLLARRGNGKNAAKIQIELDRRKNYGYVRENAPKKTPTKESQNAHTRNLKSGKMNLKLSQFWQ
jgi:hypothetical protein